MYVTLKPTHSELAHFKINKTIDIKKFCNNKILFALNNWLKFPSIVYGLRYTNYKELSLAQEILNYILKAK